MSRSKTFDIAGPLFNEWRLLALGCVVGGGYWMAIACAEWISGTTTPFSLLPVSPADLASRLGVLVLLPLLGLIADRARRRARDARDRLSVLLDAVPDLVFRLDREGRYIDFHAPDASQLAFPPEEFLGRTVHEVFGPDFANIVRQHVEAALATGKTQAWEYQVPIRGELLDFEARLRRSGDNNVVAIVRDVSRRKRAEQQLVRSEARLSEAQRIAKIGNWERDLATGEVWWSDEVYRLLGWQPGEIKPSYERFLERVHPDEIPHVMAGVAEAAKGLAAYEMDHRVVWPDGTQRVVHDRALAICDAVGKPLRLSGTLQDVTRRVELEREVAAVAERERARIARDLHDGVGQALTGISLGLGAMAQRLRAEGSAHAAGALQLAGAVQETIAETRRVVRLLSNAVSEGTTLSMALKVLAQEVREYSNVVCGIECPDEEPLRDPEVAMQVYRIAQEAVANALRHGKPSGIELRYRRDGESLRLEVLDDGIGISDAAQNGDGLGLENMRFRARMIDGSVSIERRGADGTRVLCTFPLSSPRMMRAKHDGGVEAMP
jgi:PAS domain S-box-containing protein